MQPLRRRDDRRNSGRARPASIAICRSNRSSGSAATSAAFATSWTRSPHGDEVFIISPTEAEVERLHEILSATKLAATGRLHYPIGTLHAGFRLRAASGEVREASRQASS